MKPLCEMMPSELCDVRGRQLLEGIRAAEGRVLVAEVVAPSAGFVRPLTNAELAAAFGADLILLNGYDTLQPTVGGLPPAAFEPCDAASAIQVLK
ncbi:MAG: hypothetical protein GX496_12720, partial [Firmicutes bacterium]|nr:hypothetical protein [Bacillota bacterium]